MADFTWTDAQQKAIDAHNGTLLVCAAAGSGKTAVLVERIVKMITRETDPVPPGSLLVVTFTNAAAAEMRQKIFSRVNKVLADSPGQRVKLAVRLEEMTVCTMDAYCMQLVRENFNECDISPDFRILDAGEETALKNMAVQEIIDERYGNGDPAFLKLTKLFENGRDDTQLVGGILALSDFASVEAQPETFLRKIGDAFSKKTVKKSKWGEILTGRILQGLGYAADLMDKALDDAAMEPTVHDKCAALFESEAAACRRLIDGLDSLDWDGMYAALSSLFELFNRHFPTIRGFGENPYKVCAKAKRDGAKKTVSKLLDLFAANEAENKEDVRVLAPAVETLIDTVTAYDRLLMEKKRALGSFSFSDITHFALGLLYDPSAPDGKTALARTLTDAFHEILIDEYQDTNHAQDTLFSCLSKNEENLFLVGDVKQSIYRFRLASPEIFVDKMKKYPYYDGKEKKAKLILSSNFRSRKGITEAVNYMFSAVMSRDLGEIDYNEDEALHAMAKDYPPSPTPDASLYLIDIPDKKMTLAAEAQTAAALIEQKIAEGITVHDKNGDRKARYGDFCILLRTVKNTAEIFADALRKKNIPVYFDSREGFFDSKEIRLARAFLNAVDNPLNDVDLLALLLSPVVGFTPGQVAELRLDALEGTGEKSLSLYAALLFAADNGDAAAEEALKLLSTYRRLSVIAPCYEVIDAVFEETPLMSAVGAMDGGRLRVANLRALAAAAVRFSADEEKSLSAFLRYLDMLEENGAELQKGSAGAATDSVIICSMHRSKGLEYPFVIVAGMNKQFRLNDSNSTLQVSAECGVGLKMRDKSSIRVYDTLSSVALRVSQREKILSEELRIYYVAFTRAREKLFLLAAHDNIDKKIAEWQALLGRYSVLPPCYVGGVRTPLEWVLPAFMRHPAFRPFSAYDVPSVPANFQLDVRQFVLQAPAQEPAPAAGAEADPILLDRLLKQMHYVYPYLPVSSAASKHTASALQEERFTPQYFGQKVPQFLRGDESLSPADVGTATHRFLEYCSFADPAPDVPAEKKKLIASGILEEKEAAAVDDGAIAAFFRSDVFRRVLNAQEVFREKEFSMRKSVTQLDASIPEAFADEMSVLIGKIDLLFIEDGQAVIVDYKTDHVRNAEDLRPRYSSQLAIYAEAAEKLYGVKVKEKILYSLHKKAWIHL
ncbi:MAG: UvrD-helicase domain-containing protein [Clostridia bacterium]|nr:UvrD-helicase domain-containing protein [Clostridia bacterium]